MTPRLRRCFVRMTRRRRLVPRRQPAVRRNPAVTPPWHPRHAIVPGLERSPGAAAAKREGRLDAISAIRQFLSATTVPAEVVDEFLSDAPDLWLASAAPVLLAGDLALCHPPLRTAEVRAVARPLGDGIIRLTVFAHDRHGLLADTTGVVSASGFQIVAASAMTCRARRVALHALTLAAGELEADAWDRLGARLREVGAGDSAAVTFTPEGEAQVESVPFSPGHHLVTVRAPDQVGLLWAICSWFADHQLSIETAHVSGEPGEWVTDRFVVEGTPDVADLARRISV